MWIDGNGPSAGGKAGCRPMLGLGLGGGMMFDGAEMDRRLVSGGVITPPSAPGVCSGASLWQGCRFGAVQLQLGVRVCAELGWSRAAQPRRRTAAAGKGDDGRGEGPAS
jgi:hypothetical protein